MEWRIEGEKIGLIAQEVSEIIPEVVVTYEYKRNESSRSDEKTAVDHLGLYYTDLIPVLIKSIQEQQVTIEGLSNRIDQFVEEKKESQTLLERVEKLEKMINRKNEFVNP